MLSKHDIQFQVPFHGRLRLTLVLLASKRESFNVILSLQSVDESSSMTIHKKAIEQYFPVLLFIMLHKVDLTLQSADEILTTLYKRFIHEFNKTEK